MIHFWRLAKVVLRFLFPQTPWFIFTGNALWTEKKSCCMKIYGILCRFLIWTFREGRPRVCARHLRPIRLSLFSWTRYRWAIHSFVFGFLLTRRFKNRKIAKCAIVISKKYFIGKFINRFPRKIMNALALCREVLWLNSFFYCAFFSCV